MDSEFRRHRDEIRAHSRGIHRFAMFGIAVSAVVWLVLMCGLGYLLWAAGSWLMAQGGA